MEFPRPTGGVDRGSTETSTTREDKGSVTDEEEEKEEWTTECIPGTWFGYDPRFLRRDTGVFKYPTLGLWVTLLQSSAPETLH